jgi:hypothetical protein
LGRLEVAESSIWRARVSDVPNYGAHSTVDQGRVYYTAGADGAEVKLIDGAASPTVRTIARADAGYDITDLAATSGRLLLMEERRKVISKPCVMACIPQWTARVVVRLISPDAGSDRQIGRFDYTGSPAYPPLLAASEDLWAVSVTQSGAGPLSTTIDVRDYEGNSVWKTTTSRVDHLLLGGRHVVYAAYDESVTTLSATLVDLDGTGTRSVGEVASGISLSQDGRYLAFDPSLDWRCSGVRIMDLVNDESTAPGECIDLHGGRFPAVTTGSAGPVLAWWAVDPLLPDRFPNLCILRSPKVGQDVEIAAAAGAMSIWYEGDSVAWAIGTWADSGLTTMEWAGFDLSSAEFRIH